MTTQAVLQGLDAAQQHCPCLPMSPGLHAVAHETSLKCWKIEGLCFSFRGRGFISSSGFEFWEDAVVACFFSAINAQASCWVQPVLPWQN